MPNNIITYLIFLTKSLNLNVPVADVRLILENKQILIDWLIEWLIDVLGFVITVPLKISADEITA